MHLDSLIENDLSSSFISIQYSFSFIVIVVIVINLWLRYLQNLLICNDNLIVQVLGAFWYFFSTQRLTACWHKACENYSDGLEFSFKCDHSFRKLPSLDDFCSIDTPNRSTFEFGIFLEALRSGILRVHGFSAKSILQFLVGHAKSKVCTYYTLYYSIS